MTDKSTHELGCAERLDPTIRPQDDFFGYTNAKWLIAHPIPASETRWGAFDVLHDQALKDVRALCEELVGNSLATDELQQQIRDFYQSGLDFDKHQDNNRSLLQKYFARIDATKPGELPTLLGELHQHGLGSPWRVMIDADDQDSSKHILHISQPKLTLPDRDYYLEESAKMQTIRDAYRAHTSAMHAEFPTLADTDQDLWRVIWDFEHTLAEHIRTKTELRDVQNNYHNMPFADIVRDYPHCGWAEYAAALGWTDTSNISVDQPEVLTFVDSLLDSKSLDDWKIYLKWLMLVEYGGKISESIARLRFEFFGRVLSGVSELQPLWKRVVSVMDGAIGEGIGKIYAAKHFPEQSKQQVLALVEDIRTAYRQRIEALDWMSEPTKKIALQKLANIKVLIGYPDTWRDFSGLAITSDSYLGNTLTAEEFNTRYWLDKLSQPTSRDDWFMHPQTVNAYHDPNRLVICFPAAILQAPFFSPDAPYAANIGAIGAVIGHEFTHGFDDQGCQFDADGNVRTWQTETERAEFAKRAGIIIQQANQFEVVPGVHLKGDLVIGESIADLGGLELARYAFRMKKSEDTAENADGLSDDEFFFVSFAATECGQTREERKRQLALIDPHPAETFRVNAMLAHCDDFYQTFDVQPTDKLYRAPEDRAKIW